jgi:hypothetical protein
MQIIGIRQYVILLICSAVANLITVLRYRIFGAAASGAFLSIMATVIPYFTTPNMQLVYKPMLRGFPIFWLSVLVVSISFWRLGTDLSLALRATIYLGVVAAIRVAL